MSVFNNLIVQEARPLPLIVLADTSASMASDGKINVLNNAIRDLIESLRGEGGVRAEVYLSVITFGSAANHYIDFQKVKDVDWTDLQPSGRTSMGAAVELAKNMIEDSEIIPSRSYAPTVVMLSDGIPTDSWDGAIANFHESERASKAFRMAMSIGAGDQGKEVLSTFIGDSDMKVFEAKDANEISKFFKFVTMSVSQRVKSTNPNAPVTISFEDADEDLEDFF